MKKIRWRFGRFRVRALRAYTFTMTSTNVRLESLYRRARITANKIHFKKSDFIHGSFFVLAGIMFLLFTYILWGQANETIATDINSDTQVAKVIALQEIDTKLNSVEPATGNDYELKIVEEESSINRKFPKPDKDILMSDAIMVPKQNTVISSSRDGQIISVPFDDGDEFKKGDILIQYDCRDREAEINIAKAQKDLTINNAEIAYKLFNLDMISMKEKEEFTTERANAIARQKIAEAKLNECNIRSLFNGRVTKKLANAGEFTRTDRVLLEVASNEPLYAEFLVPSKSLQWVNIGTPVNINIYETNTTYNAEIIRIYGEVDPITQTIQMVAELDEYEDRLLPGMSGTATISHDATLQAGIIGYLEE
jgi:RND family efflux transporter MFP subunit